MRPDRETTAFLDDILRGKLTRRQTLRRAAGLGLTAPALTGLMAGRAASVAAQAGAYEPQGPQIEQLIFWTRSSPDTSPQEWDALMAVTNAYTEAVGTPVELITVPDADFRSRMSLAAPTGEGPDVFGPVAHDWIGEFAIQQIAAEVTPENIPNQEDYLASTLQLVSVDGTIYAMPFVLESTALIYNADMVSTPPTTWEELVTMATELTSGDVFGFGFPLLEQYHAGGFFQGFGSYIFAYDAETGQFNTEDIGLNNDGGVQAAMFLRDMFHQDQPPLPDVAIDRNNMHGAQEGMMESGQLAMTINGPWREPPLIAAGVTPGVALLPTLPNGEPMRPFLGLQAMVVNAYTENQEAAFDFVNFMTSTTGIELAFAGFNKLPARQSSQPAAIEINPNMEAWAAQAETAIPMPNIPAMANVWTPWGDALDAIIPPNAPDEDIPGLLDNAVAQIQQAIADTQG